MAKHANLDKNAPHLASGVHFRSGGCNFKNPLQPNSLHYGIIYTRIHIRFVLVKPLCGIFRLIESLIGGRYVKKLSIVFWVLAILLSDIMCAVVAYNYCDLLWGGKYAGYSAPASTAFLYAIPFAIGMIVSIVLAIICRKKAAK